MTVVIALVIVLILLAGMRGFLLYSNNFLGIKCQSITSRDRR
jgi:hypothetical protein